MFGRKKQVFTPDMKKKIEILDKVRHEIFDAYKLIFAIDNWCKYALAREENGEQLFDPADERAIQWCLLGAVYKKEDYSTETLTFIRNFARMKGINEVSRFNDQEGHEAVLNLFEEMLKVLGVKLTFFNKDGKEIK